MIKQQLLKPLVFDKKKFFENLHNWVIVENNWHGFDYNDCDDNSQHYDFTLRYRVGDVYANVWVQVHHQWTEIHEAGDYETCPYTEIVDESHDTYVTAIQCDDDCDMDVTSDLLYRLEYVISDNILV